MKKFLVLVIIILVSMIGGCSDNSINDNNGSNDQNENILGEDILNEDILKEDILNEIITEEIYLKEIVIIEEKITELLLQNDKIKEVIFCKTIYIKEEHIKDFAENSNFKELFDNSVELEPLLTKISIGTGVILTLTVLSVINISGPVGSIVASAAPAALQGALVGTGVGTLIGGLTGASDGIDESGRTSALIGFAGAVVGLVVTTVSVIVSIPSGGASGITAAFGVRLFLAGVSLIGTAYAGYNAIKTFQTTDAAEIDWNNVDWNKVGASAVQKSIEGAANGYMWGSIIGSVQGGAEGYDNYYKHCAPYSSYAERLRQTPKNGDRGNWTGERGESNFVLKDPIKLSDGTLIKEITYKNGIPDFSKYAKASVKIQCMTDARYGTNSNFAQADEALASYWTKINYSGKTWTARDISNYRSAHNLTWHEMNNMETMQLVPVEVNSTWGHLGGVGEYNAMLSNTGGSDFD